MDFALAQLALIFLPGIIWASMDSIYGARPKPSQAIWIVRAFLFGVVTYTALGLVYTALGAEFGRPLTEGRAGRSDLDLLSMPGEILWSVPLSFALSIAWLWAVRYRLLTRFVSYIGASRRSGNEDVWSYLFNSEEYGTEFVHLRDVGNGYVFTGWVAAYSEDEDHRELVLSDAVVHDGDGEEVYRTPLLYVSRAKDGIWIEFPDDESRGGGNA